jgi:hypothetical protein
MALIYRVVCTNMIEVDPAGDWPRSQFYGSAQLLHWSREDAEAVVAQLNENDFCGKYVVLDAEETDEGLGGRLPPRK